MKAYIIPMKDKLVWLKSFFIPVLYEEEKNSILVKIFEYVSMLLSNYPNSHEIVVSELIDWCVTMEEIGLVKPDSSLELAVGLYKLECHLINFLKSTIPIKETDCIIFKDFTNVDVIVVVGDYVHE